MTISFAIFTFINVWWITLFAVLPFHARRDEHTGVGYKAAPQTPNWKKLCLINSAISLAVTGLLALLIQLQVISLKNMGW